MCDFVKVCFYDITHTYTYTHTHTHTHTLTYTHTHTHTYTHSALEAKHFEHLDEIFMRLAEYIIYTKLCKCKFLQQCIIFLGHVIDEHGIHITLEKVKYV